MKSTIISNQRNQIIDYIRRKIFSGELSEGSQLKEMPLANELGVSRGSIREAIRQLEQEGLLEYKNNRGVFISVVEDGPIEEVINPIRRRIERYALKLIFQNQSRDVFDSWDDIMARLYFACKQKDVGLCTEADIEFHRRIIEVSESSDLLAIWKTVVSRTRIRIYKSYLNFKPSKFMSIYNNHEELLNLIKVCTVSGINKLNIC
ncbi:MAG: hypothetical protein COA79_09615 [Planctomycetota bacterium]|nr:MAG: hypothetical protein COA79_09615 [Planctomycetota bacterium]